MVNIVYTDYNEIRITEYGTPVFIGNTTASYVEFDDVQRLSQFSSSITSRTHDLELFSSSLNASFATDAELNSISQSLNGSIQNVSQSLYDFKLISNTGSFTGSFTGDGSLLKNISASNIIGLTEPIWGAITGSLTNQTDLQSALDGKQSTLSLTTTGTSGAATLVGSTLNIPQYQSVLTNPVTGTGTAGQVAYFNGTSAVTGSANLFWDNANGRLGIGTNAPTQKLEITAGNIIIDNNSEYRSKSTGGSSLPVLKVDTSNNLLAGSIFLGSQFISYTSTAFRWYQYPGSVLTERMQLNAAGNLLIQNGGTFTDNGQRLQVYGSTLLRGSGTTSATTALLVQNNDATPARLMSVRDDGRIYIGSQSDTQAPFLAGYTSTTPHGASQRALGLVWNGGAGTRPNPAMLFTATSDINWTSGVGDMFQTLINFNPSSGTGVLNSFIIQSTINQTGGANGITRGLYVSPILTAAADWRSIETSNNTGYAIYTAGTANSYFGGNVGIGTASPGASLSIASSATLITGIQLNNAGSIGYIYGDGTSLNFRAGGTFGLQINAGSSSLTNTAGGTGAFRIDLQALTTAPIFSFLGDGDTGIGRNAADTLTMFAGGERARIDTSGNFVIGTTAASARLHVRGSGTTSATTALLVQNSTPTALMTVRDDGYTLFGSGNSGTPLATLVDFRGNSDSDYIQVARVSSSSDRYVRIYAGGQIDALSIGTSSPPFTFAAANNPQTSGNRGLFSITNTFNPTSGNATYTSFLINQTINQTGGANGITRGLYVNPTLTAAADWRSIEFSNSTGWGIYGAGTAENYLNGGLAIGSTATYGLKLAVNGAAWVGTAIAIGAGASAGTKALSVFKHFTNSLQTAVEQSGWVNSDTVNTAIGFNNILQKTATGSTANYIHYSVQESTLLTGSLTNQYGYYVNQNFDFATNNYGYYGDVLSGSGRWNLYMNGTAANYLAGNTSIGTTTESARLLVRGSGTTSATTALLVQNSTPSELLTVRDSGEIILHRNIRIGNAGTGAPSIFPFTTAQSSTNTTGTNLSFFSYTTTESATNGTFTFTGEQLASTVSNQIHLLSIRTFAPTSGTAVHNNFEIRPTINQTGGANGITRGLYVNPTLTAAADWRSIETSNNTGYAAYFAGSADLFLGNGTDIQIGTTTGTKIGTATNQLIGLWNATPIAQPTTAVAAATRVGGAGNTVTDTDTFDGYTIAQLVKALRNMGALA